MQFIQTALEFPFITNIRLLLSHIPKIDRVEVFEPEFANSTDWNYRHKLRNSTY